VAKSVNLRWGTKSEENRQRKNHSKMPFDQDGSEMIKRPIRPDVGAKQFNAKGAIKRESRVTMHIQKIREPAEVFKENNKLILRKKLRSFAKSLFKASIRKY